MEWYDKRENLVSLIKFMEAVGLEIDDIPYFLEKPWKWNDEYNLMSNNPDWENYDDAQMEELNDTLIGYSEL